MMAWRLRAPLFAPWVSSTAVGKVSVVAKRPRVTRSKHALLEAAVRTHLDNAATGATQIGELDLGALGADRTLLRPVVRGLGRWFLDEMDRMKDLTRVLEHDGQRMDELTVKVKTDIVDLSYRTAAKLIATLVPGAKDPEATAVILLGALVALRRTAWTFGLPPLDIDDGRALTTWTELTLITLDAGRNEDRS